MNLDWLGWRFYHIGGLIPWSNDVAYSCFGISINIVVTKLIGSHLYTEPLIPHNYLERCFSIQPIDQPHLPNPISSIPSHPLFPFPNKYPPVGFHPQLILSKTTDNPDDTIRYDQIRSHITAYKSMTTHRTTLPNLHFSPHFSTHNSQLPSR